jgi:hypothetical protein
MKMRGEGKKMRRRGHMTDMEKKEKKKRKKKGRRKEKKKKNLKMVDC